MTATQHSKDFNGGDIEYILVNGDTVVERVIVAGTGYPAQEAFARLRNSRELYPNARVYVKVGGQAPTGAHDDQSHTQD